MEKEIRTPKVLEKSPEVFGMDLGKVGVAAGCFIGLLFVGFYNIKVGLIFPLLAGVYFYIHARFPAKGEMNQFIKFRMGYKCIEGNDLIKNLVDKGHSIVENEDKNSEDSNIEGNHGLELQNPKRKEKSS